MLALLKAFTTRQPGPNEPMGKEGKYPDYNFDSKYVHIEGKKMHYVDEGPRDGQILLMVHGNPTWSYLYRHFINDLSKNYRCIAMDHLGFGLSDKDADIPLMMKDHVRRLNMFVEALELRNITLVVQDWGGVIGLSWAITRKEIISRMVIMNTTGFIPEGGPLSLFKMRPFPWAIPGLWLLKLPIFGELFIQGMNGFVRFLLPVAISNHERTTPEVMRGYLGPYPTYASRRAHLESVRQISTGFVANEPTHILLENTGKELEGWDVPVQIIWGMDDPVFVPHFCDIFEKKLPNHQETLKIPHSNHFLQDDTPEPIIAKIREFVEKVPIVINKTSPQ